MSNLSKEVLREYITEQRFKSSSDVLAVMKEMFRDVLQEALESVKLTLVLDFENNPLV